jgi:hypothetical protein
MWKMIAALELGCKFSEVALGDKSEAAIAVPNMPNRGYQGTLCVGQS